MRGTPPLDAKKIAHDRDHPRVCGEHLAQDVAQGVVGGSSPRMRGTRSCWCLACADCGIIPAYAGNTGRNVGNHELPREHPRVCGEHVSRAWRIILLRGSSPRMRGTHGGEQLALVVFGIIPAYAGNTHVRHWRCRWQGDHPRVCGEHSTSSRPPDVVSGSSPRMRGTHDLDAFVVG